MIGVSLLHLGWGTLSAIWYVRLVGNKLKLNADKTHLMTVGTRERLQLQNSQVVVMMDGFKLEESEDKVETLRGCEIEPTLKWHKQIEYYTFSPHSLIN